MVQVQGMKVEVEQPWVLGGLSVFPLVSTAVGEHRYVPGPIAFEQGLVKVSELDPPQVPFLAVENLALVDVLLVEGETLVGGNQNRTLNATILLTSESRTVVPVSCVEAGRWGHPRNVARSRSHLPGSIRAAKIANLSSDGGPARWRSNQGLVWEEVDRQAQRHGVRSQTSALEDVQAAIENDLDAQIADLVACDGQVGIACATGARVLGVDIFDRPDALGSYLTALVAGYRLDADEGARPGLVEEVELFLAQVDHAPCAVGPAVGLGEELRLSGSVTGLCLRVDRQLVHLAAFPRPAG
ncbi:MAG: hypothetical protein M0Z46_19030 [Actinomycetota bacterium]|nr:hypothetical protein [Actinomycetota bacterium]